MPDPPAPEIGVNDEMATLLVKVTTAVLMFAVSAGGAFTVKLKVLLLV